jgi:hypothetical protein
VGTSTPIQYAAKLRLAEHAATEAGKKGTESAALLTKRIVQANSPARLRGVGKAGRRLGVRYNMHEAGDVSQALVFVTGPYQLIERDTKPHRIPRQRGRRARQRYAVIPGVGVRASANHPGTKGKHTFEKSVAEAYRFIGAAYMAQLEARLRSIF